MRQGLLVPLYYFAAGAATSEAAMLLFRGEPRWPWVAVHAAVAALAIIFARRAQHVR